MERLDDTLFEFSELPLKNELIEFIEDVKLKDFRENDHHLEYYSLGEGDKILLMLPSSNGHAITFFKYISTLSEHVKVIVPRYQEGVDLETQCRGFYKLAQSYQPESLFVFGHSFGGIIGQLMVKYYPDDIHGLCLLDGETKTKHINPKLIKRFVKSYNRLNRTLRFFSTKSMHRSLSKRLTLDVAVALDENKHFWEALYKQALQETSKDRMRLVYDNVREFWMSYEFSEEDFESYTGEVLFLHVEDSTKRVEVKELNQLFKSAKEIIYPISYRMALVTCYNNVIEELSNLMDIPNTNTNYDIIKEGQNE